MRLVWVAILGLTMAAAACGKNYEKNAESPDTASATSGSAPGPVVDSSAPSAVQDSLLHSTKSSADTARHAPPTTTPATGGKR